MKKSEFKNNHKPELKAEDLISEWDFQIMIQRKEVFWSAQSESLYCGFNLFEMTTKS